MNSLIKSLSDEVVQTTADVGNNTNIDLNQQRLELLLRHAGLNPASHY
jgi:hypothetical protein